MKYVDAGLAGKPANFLPLNPQPTDGCHPSPQTFYMKQIILCSFVACIFFSCAQQSNTGHSGEKIPVSEYFNYGDTD
jgi:hypothetical protein